MRMSADGLREQEKLDSGARLPSNQRDSRGGLLRCVDVIKLGSLATTGARRLRVWGSAYAGATLILLSVPRISNH